MRLQPISGHLNANAYLLGFSEPRPMGDPVNPVLFPINSKEHLTKGNGRVHVKRKL